MKEYIKPLKHDRTTTHRWCVWAEDSTDENLDYKTDRVAEDEASILPSATIAGGCRRLSPSPSYCTADGPN